MRKIISILVALGLVLAFSAVAMPTTAATCTAVATLTNPCAGGSGNYCITFTSPVTLLPGNDALSVEFPAGTTFVTGFSKSNITVNGTAPVSANLTGTRIEFPVPVAVGTIWAGANVTVCVSGVTNPATAGPYTVNLDYKLVCCPAVVFGCATYTIKPARSTYKFILDFGPTYPGIAKDFVPPFKACGQADNVTGLEGFNTTYDNGKWFSQFDLTLITDVEGCAGYFPVMVNFELCGAPSTSAVAELRLQAGSTWYAWNLTTKNATTSKASWGLPGGFNLTAVYNVTTPGLIHFDTPGKDWKFCWKLEYLGAADPCTPIPGGILASREVPISVYQWKDAAKITLREKWNLISLPLVPLVDPPVATTLASIPAADLANIVSIWHYNCVTLKWAVWPTPGPGQDALTELKDGEAYWMRVKYPLAGCGNITWWVWGTEKPMPPAAPAQYPVCDGWNMVGFLGLTAMNTSTYLWNWAPADVVTYGWDQNCWNLQGWNLITASETLKPGQGYWMAFNGAGFIYVP